MTKKLVVAAALTACAWISCAGTAVAQSTPGVKPPQNIPLEVQVVISRYQGDKRISSLPYVLSLKSTLSSNPTANFGGGSALLRLGSRVPIRTQVYAPAADGKPATTSDSVRYENVGTNIDCGATALEDGRFEVSITINESSVVTDPLDLKRTPSTGDYPVFRSYQSTNTMFIKDGQTVQFTAASDRVSGEVVRVEVKLTVVK